MTITTATTPEDYHRIFRFRYAVFVEEMGTPLPDADHKQRTLSDALDERATHLCAYRGGELIATCRILWGIDGIPQHYNTWYALHAFEDLAPSDLSFTGRMMVAGAWRGSSAALALATEAYRLGQKNRIGYDFIHTAHRLVPFFERLGYRRFTNELVDPEFGLRVPLMLVLNDLAHLESQRSPFLKIARKQL